MFSTISRSLVALSFSTCVFFNAHATIKIGLILPLSGPLASTGKDIAAGTQAAINTVNKAGGIKGQPIELIIVDDRFDPKQSEELARDLVTNKGAVALLSCFGTVNCMAIVKVAQETGVALLGPIAGAEALRDAKLTKIYSVRANAGQEIGALLKYSAVVNPNNTAVIVQDDGFGKAYANSLLAVSDQYKFKPSLQLAFDPKTPNYDALAKRIMATGTQPAVLLIANTAHSVALIKALNDAKYLGQLLNLAGQANAGFVKGLADANQLAVFATVTPSPLATSSFAASAYRTQWQAQIGNSNYSYIGFEAFLNAQVLIAALKKSGTFSSKSIEQTISQLNKFSFHELSYSFIGNLRQSGNYTDLAVMSKGSFKH
jgi:branched-chain amino acid transport system substrate-binding protein